MFKLTSKTNNAQIEVDKEFIKRSSFLKNMMDDLNSWDNHDEPIVLHQDFDLIQKVYNLYSLFKDVEINSIKLFDYMENNLDEYVEKYPMNNIDPPFQSEIIKYSQENHIDTLLPLVKLIYFLDMKGIMRVLSLSISYQIKNMEDYDEKVKIFTLMRQRLGHII
jgi:hypothetical protein